MHLFAVSPVERRNVFPLRKRSRCVRSLIHGTSSYSLRILHILMCYSSRFCSSTRGLDASTALEFVKALRIGTDIARMTTIVSLYQAGESRFIRIRHWFISDLFPGEQLYEHFDKVCLIYEGRMAYFGPASSARQYFIDLGFEPVPRQTTSDFLVSGTIFYYSTKSILPSRIYP